MNTLNFYSYSFVAYINENVHLNNFDMYTCLISAKNAFDKVEFFRVLLYVSPVIVAGAVLLIILKHIFKKKEADANNIMAWVYFTTRYFITTLFCSYIICSHIISIGKCISGSMEPTIMTGSYTIGNRLAYFIDAPQRGDVIEFFHTDNYGNIYSYLKRVIGIAGDTIDFKDGCVYVNGQCIIEDYIAENAETYAFKSFTVPEGCVFVLGDNRENSLDSRFWIEPFVKIESIISKIMIIL